MKRYAFCDEERYYYEICYFSFFDNDVRIYRLKDKKLYKDNFDNDIAFTKEETTFVTSNIIIKFFLKSNTFSQ